MKTKRLLRFIREINYTVDQAAKGKPLTDYDRGFKAACNLMIGFVVGLSRTPVRDLYNRYCIWRYRRVDSKQETSDG